MEWGAALNLVGQSLSHFRVLAKIGAGGMGEVYEAEDTRLRRRVALKVLISEPMTTAEGRRRLLREARAAAAVTHPNIAVVHEIDEADGIAFMAMERLEGRTLRQLLEQGVLPPREALRVAREVATGLAHAHSAGVLHGDLKPENVMVLPDGRVKILDFGLARHTPRLGSDEATLSATLSTAPGTFAGTPAYASPEQVRGESIGARSDLFSLGVILYEMLTGASPFRRRTPFETASAVLHDEPPPPSRTLQTALPGLDAIVAGCLAKEPDRRCASAERLLEQLQGLSHEPRRVSRSRRALAIAASLVVVALIVEGARRFVLPRLAVSPDPPADRAASAETRGPRRSVAVIGFRNVSGNSETDWLATALAEMLTTELASGEFLRTLPGESIARIKHDLRISDEPEFGAETLAKIRDSLGADFVVAGMYVLLGEAKDGQIRLDLRLQDVESGETLTSVEQTGSVESLFDLVSLGGEKLRSVLGVPSGSETERAALAGSVPGSAEANRLYAEGLNHARSYGALGARELLERSISLDPGRAATHVALALVLEMLGYQERQIEEAKRAFELAVGLPREMRLKIESMYRQANGEPDRAIELQRTLWDSYPDVIDHGLRLAALQSRAGKGSDALVTVAELRQRIDAARKDPRVDLAEASALNTMSESPRAAEAAERAAKRAAAAGASQLVAMAKLVQGTALNGMGDYDAVRRVTEEARDLYAAAGDRFGVARAWSTVAVAAQKQGDFATALSCHERALAVFRELGALRNVGVTLNNMANTYYDQGDLLRAKALYEEAAGIHRKIGDRAGLPHPLGSLASLLASQGELAASLQMQKQSLQAFEAIGHQAGAARTVSYIGLILLLQGELGDALTRLEDAGARQRALNLKDDLAATLISVGEARLAQDDLPAARRAAEESLQIREGAGIKDGVVEAKLLLGRAALAEGHPSDAERVAAEANAFFRDAKNDGARLVALDLLAQARLEQNRLADALETVGEAAAIASRIQDRQVTLGWAITAARIAGATGPPEAPRRRLSEIEDEARQRGYVGLLYAAQLALGELEGRSGQQAAARARLAALESDAKARGYMLFVRESQKASGRLTAASAARPPAA